MPRTLSRAPELKHCGWDGNHCSDSSATHQGALLWPLSKNEVLDAISMASGSEGIATEVLKHSRPKLFYRMHSVLVGFGIGRKSQQDSGMPWLSPMSRSEVRWTVQLCSYFGYSTSATVRTDPPRFAILLLFRKGNFWLDFHCSTTAGKMLWTKLPCTCPSNFHYQDNHSHISQFLQVLCITD